MAREGTGAQASPSVDSASPTLVAFPSSFMRGCLLGYPRAQVVSALAAGVTLLCTVVHEILCSLVSLNPEQSRLGKLMVVSLPDMCETLASIQHYKTDKTRPANKGVKE